MIRYLRAKYGEVFKRSLELKRAIERGDINEGEYQAFLDKIAGRSDVTTANEQAVETAREVIDGVDRVTYDDGSVVDEPFSIGKGDAEKTFAEQIGLVYVSTRDQESSSQNAYPTKRAAQAALGFLAEGTWYDSGRSDSANAAQRINSETESLVSWARQAGFLIDSSQWDGISGAWEQLEGASEHNVFRALNGSRVVKTTIPPNFGARGLVTEYTQNAMWSNQLFGDDIEFAGVLSDETGTAIVITQPFYVGESPTQQEISDWFTGQGYELAGVNRWKHPVTGADIADTHEGNFIKDENGALFPIDLQILKVGTSPDDISFSISRKPSHSDQLTALQSLAAKLAADPERKRAIMKRASDNLQKQRRDVQRDIRAFGKDAKTRALSGRGWPPDFKSLQYRTLGRLEARRSS